MYKQIIMLYFEPHKRFSFKQRNNQKRYKYVEKEIFKKLSAITFCNVPLWTVEGILVTLWNFSLKRRWLFYHIHQSLTSYLCKECVLDICNYIFLDLFKNISFTLWVCQFGHAIVQTFWLITLWNAMRFGQLKGKLIFATLLREVFLVMSLHRWGG